DHDAVVRRPEATALPAALLPRMDGMVLGDPAWTNVEPLTELWQNAPDEGQPVSERTEIRILYSPDTLYFGVICFDQDPGSIIVSDSRRDAPLNETDAFQIILDTYRDGQNGFVFDTNPAGIEYDGQVTNEGQGVLNASPQSGGSAGGFNINWDGSWLVRTQISEIGWSAEFAIPFRTLRFANGGSQVWGLNFQRNIRRRNENAFWALLPRQFNLHRLSLAGSLVGLDIPSQRNLRIMPYALGETSRGVDISDASQAVGVDLKYSLTPSLTLDLSYNTDFAQVEVDDQQINLNRFQLFFPEKRPFFLENAGLFSVGSPQEVEMFFSRRIGIGPQGSVVPITGGGRLTGKLRGFDVGVLSMSTESVDDTGDLEAIPGNSYTVARVNKELPNRSALGAMFVNRQAAPGNDFNRTTAIDGRLGVGRYGQVIGFAAQTSTPGLEGDDYAFKLGANYNSEAWQLVVNYTDVAGNFNPEVGFLRRENFSGISSSGAGFGPGICSVSRRSGPTPPTGDSGTMPPDSTRPGSGTSTPTGSGKMAMKSTRGSILPGKGSPGPTPLKFIPALKCLRGPMTTSRHNWWPSPTGDTGGPSAGARLSGAISAARASTWSLPLISGPVTSSTSRQAGATTPSIFRAGISSPISCGPNSPIRSRRDYCYWACCNITTATNCGRPMSRCAGFRMPTPGCSWCITRGVRWPGLAAPSRRPATAA
ncbi:MAG: hypothetical protein IIB42_10180, partial [Candidatus Marinimicrobia bacterium]|nr:hypothetical protein [Candidatus Neomarinimicrobiota bacterium]